MSNRLDPQDIEEIVEKVARRVVGLKAQAAPAPFPRLTVRQFAEAVELSEEVIRRKIRVQAIPRKFIFGMPYKISPDALELFGVTRPDAQARLEARNLWTAPSPSQA